uniref:N-myc downstream regulated gene 1 n=1 Tax=Mus musculus TaxID=10090 RepID=E9Q7V2_MOUSE
MSRELHDVDLAEVKPLVEKGESITGLLQEFDVQEQDIETLHGSLHVTLMVPLPSQWGTCTPQWISWLKCFLESFTSLGSRVSLAWGQELAPTS